jgi:hypothetical protein
MQALIRRTGEADFPAVARFRQLAADGTFNSTGWVAGHLLRIAFGGERPGDVVVRVPEQPVPGAAG